MTTDERLDRLTERVDAIAQSVELLTTLHRDLEEQAAARSKETAARFADLGQFINSLAHIAEAHEHRLDRLEGQ
ncbi:MAG: hypothetical protein ABSB88_03915 [Bryobacteraceae bacterium]|jgi:DNA-binding protein H-NS